MLITLQVLLFFIFYGEANISMTNRDSTDQKYLQCKRQATIKLAPGISLDFTSRERLIVIWVVPKLADIHTLMTAFWLKVRPGETDLATCEMSRRLTGWPQRMAVILTHWDRHNMAAVYRTTFSNGFSWMKMCWLRLKFHWNLFSRVQ